MLHTILFYLQILNKFVQRSQIWSARSAYFKWSLNSEIAIVVSDVLISKVPFIIYAMYSNWTALAQHLQGTARL